MYNATVQVATDGRQVGLAIILLGLALGLTLDEPLLQRGRLQVLLLTRASERLVKPRHAFRLPSTIRFYPSSETNNIQIFFLIGRHCISISNY